MGLFESKSMQTSSQSLKFLPKYDYPDVNYFESNMYITQTENGERAILKYNNKSIEYYIYNSIFTQTNNNISSFIVNKISSEQVDDTYYLLLELMNGGSVYELIKQIQSDLLCNNKKDIILCLVLIYKSLQAYHGIISNVKLKHGSLTFHSVFLHDLRVSENLTNFRDTRIGFRNLSKLEDLLISNDYLIKIGNLEYSTIEQNDEYVFEEISNFLYRIDRLLISENKDDPSFDSNFDWYSTNIEIFDILIVIQTQWVDLANNKMINVAKRLEILINNIHQFILDIKENV